MRVKEVRELRRTAFLQSLFLAISPSITVIAAVSTLLALTYSGFALTAPQAFTLFSIFTALQFTVVVLPHSLRAIAESSVAVARLQEFLELPEYRNPNDEFGKAAAGDDKDKNEPMIIMKKATLGWPEVKEAKLDKSRYSSRFCTRTIFRRFFLLCFQAVQSGRRRRTGRSPKRPIS